MWRAIHAEQTFKWNDLHWTPRLRSRAAQSLGVTWYLTFSEYGHVGTHFEGVFELNIMIIAKILFMTVLSISSIRSQYLFVRHLCGTVKLEDRERSQNSAWRRT